MRRHAVSSMVVFRLHRFENIALPCANSVLSCPQSLINDVAMVKLQMVGPETLDAQCLLDLSGGMVKRVMLARALRDGPALFCWT
jgi:ABC-type transporter Mla maintaining outer membrane lipid asymmetry ATPase subunit MlaF